MEATFLFGGEKNIQRVIESSTEFEMEIEDFKNSHVSNVSNEL